MRISKNDTLTNTEDVEAESVVDRLVDQLVRHAVKANMTGQRDSSGAIHLTKQQSINPSINQLDEHQTGVLRKPLFTLTCFSMVLLKNPFSSLL